MRQIRSASENDLQGILTILNHHILHSTAIWSESELSLEGLKIWFSQRSKNGYPIMVAVSETDEVLGYGSYAQFREKTGYRYCMEHSVYVDASAQGTGVGSALMEALLAIAKERGIHSLIAGIEATNLQSIRFHEKFGFKEVGRLPQVGFKFGRWLDLVFMQRML